MNFRHAAALALVGWYLIAPPVRVPKGDEPAYMDEQAKYRDWEILQVYKTASACEAAERRARLDVSPNNPDPWLAQFADAECVASDDPRIKGIVIKHPLNKSERRSDSDKPNNDGRSSKIRHSRFQIQPLKPELRQYPEVALVQFESGH